MDNDYTGDTILDLLDGLALEPLERSLQHLYSEAIRERRLNRFDRAVKFCHKALDMLDNSSRFAMTDVDIRKYTRGKFYLLLASIYLNQAENQENLKLAEEYYIRGQKEFSLTQRRHLESLASLGLAITHQKLKRPDEACETCETAMYNITHKSASSITNKMKLLKAIDSCQMPPACGSPSLLMIQEG